MKKAISLLLAGCLTLSLAACGSGTSTPPRSQRQRDSLCPH